MTIELQIMSQPFTEEDYIKKKLEYDNKIKAYNEEQKNIKEYDKKMLSKSSCGTKIIEAINGAFEKNEHINTFNLILPECTKTHQNDNVLEFIENTYPKLAKSYDRISNKLHIDLSSSFKPNTPVKVKDDTYFFSDL